MAENDSTPNKITQLLTQKYRCHTVVLYGSRARGQTTPTSDYDVVGVCKRGSKTRIAKKEDGKFWDVFVYSEKDLRKLNDQHLSWKHARILGSSDFLVPIEDKVLTSHSRTVSRFDSFQSFDILWR